MCEGGGAYSWMLDAGSEECVEVSDGVIGSHEGFCSKKSCLAGRGVKIKGVSILNESPPQDADNNARNLLRERPLSSVHAAWIPEQAEGGWFVVNLGVTASLAALKLTNSNNGLSDDRGLKGFKVHVSSDAAHWSQVLEASLADVRGLRDCIEPQRFVLEAFGPVQYVKITATSSYGVGPALSRIALYATPELDRGRIQTVTIKLASGDDDAAESVNGQVVTSGSSLSMGEHRASSTIGLRFQGIDVPGSASIQHASLELLPDRVARGSSSLIIHAELSPNSRVFDASASHDISTRPLTKNSAIWSSPAWSDTSSQVQSIELRAMVQEVVRQRGWEAGNAMSLVIRGQGHREVHSYEGRNGNGTPTLTIEYQTHQE